MMSEANRVRKNRAIAESGIFIALFLGLGYLFAAVPNVEFLTFTAAFTAWRFPLKRSLFIVGTGETLFAAVNPMGSSLMYPWLFAAQLPAFLVIVLIISAARPFLNRIIDSRGFPWVLGGLGFLLTLFYDIVTSLAFPLYSGYDGPAILASVAAGIPFIAVHLLSNTLIFSVILSRVMVYVRDTD